MLAVEIDVQISALLGRLEFFVAFYVLEIRADEHFRDIPIPKFVGLSRRIRIRLQMQFLVGTHKESRGSSSIRPGFRSDISAPYWHRRIRLPSRVDSGHSANELSGLVSTMNQVSPAAQQMNAHLPRRWNRNKR